MSLGRRARGGSNQLCALSAARAVDVALIGSALAAAAGSAMFAGLMLMRSDSTPDVNGLEYLAIFAKPHSVAKPAEPPAPRAASAGIDMTPVGAIARGDDAKASRYAMVAAQSDFAWVRDGSRIFAVRPGDELPGLGHVDAIVSRGGRWLLIGNAGAPLLSSGGLELAGSPRAAFERRMIFGGEIGESFPAP